MRLIGLVDGLEHVCCRYRIAAFRPHLEAAGHQLDLVPFPTSLWRGFRLGAALAHYDAVILQRRLMPGGSCALLFARKCGAAINRMA